MTSFPSLRSLLGAWASLTLASALPASGALTLTINSATPDLLWLTVTGTFDTETIGDSRGYLAIKNDWSTHQGVHTELFSAEPTIAMHDGLASGLTFEMYIQNGTETWNDSIFMVNPLGPHTAFAEGTTIWWTITLRGDGIFNPEALANLQLVSGFGGPPGANDWVRLEATTAVPEPRPALLLVAAGLPLAFLRGRRQRQGSLGGH